MTRTDRSTRSARWGPLGLLLLTLALLLAPSPSAAQGVLTFTSAEAFWRNPQDNLPGSQPGDPVITNGVPTSTISWGGASPQSGYDVTLTIPDPTQFPVADFTHRNFTVPDPSLTSVELDIVLDFQVDGVPTGPLTFTFTFTHEETPNNLDPCPYPTPPGEGCTDRVTFLDAPSPTTFTVGGKTYTLGLVFLDDMGNPVDEFITREGGTANTTELDVDFELVPPELIVTKSGPATLTLAQPGDFSLDVQNTGPNEAWNATLVDRLPDGATGGMCDLTPQIQSARVFQADGITPAPGKGPLAAGVDYTLAYAGAPACQLTLSLLSAASVVAPDERLILRYRTQLDADTQDGVTLTNVAGATEWFSDPVGQPGRETYQRSLSDGSVGVADHEDAHSVSTDPFDFLYEKTVSDPVSGVPLTSARPGDTLRYQLRFENRTPNALDGFAFVDEIDRLNASPLFEPGSLTLVSVPAGADTGGTDPNGGVAGTGLIDVADLSVAAGASVFVEFDVTLIAAIPDGTPVTDQAELVIAGAAFTLSDDPGVNGAADPFVVGDEDPTIVEIGSGPRFQVEKVSSYPDGDPALLLAGERLRYTITALNVGSEDVSDAMLRDQVPVNTTYVAGSTTLNGLAVPDGPGGVSPLAAGILVNAPGDPPGTLRAATPPDNVATVVFEVLVDPGVLDGTVISNQAFVSAPAAGVPDTPSDDPDTPVPDDPTRDVVGAVPLLFASKDAVLQVDGSTPGSVDPGDVLRYTIQVFNSGTAPATDLRLSDAVPANTSYVADSLTLNGLPVGVPDGGISPLVAGIPISSADLTPPLPGAGAGVLSPGSSALIQFDLQVDAGVANGTLIVNQATVTSAERPDLPTDGDGNPATGPEPTVVVVGDGQQLAISKQVAVVGGGAALPGSTLEYRVTVVNVASVPATSVVITDDLDAPVAGQLAYVVGSATLDGAPAGVSLLGSVLRADYSALYGPLPPGESALLRFQARIEPGLPIGTTVTNTGVVTWNTPSQTASASVSVDVGGMPGVGALGGSAWHDADFDGTPGPTERPLVAWLVDLYQGGSLLQTTTTDSAGSYQLSGLAANDAGGLPYELRFRAPDAGPSSASLGTADSPFTNGPQRITDIVLGSGANLQTLNLPIEPNGVVYDALGRVPIRGASLALLDAGSGVPLPASCFDDPIQQGQLTRGDGYYKFDLNFSAAACPAGGSYLISLTPPATGYEPGYSQLDPPRADLSTPPLSVPLCPGGASDAVPATPQRCEAQASELAPDPSVSLRTSGTAYYVHLVLDDSQLPGSSQIFNNHVPLDPELDGAVSITKTAQSVNVTRGELVPYEITVNNQLGTPIPDLGIVDRFPAGFRYVPGSARVDGMPLEPLVDLDNQELRWNDLGIEGASSRRVQLLLSVGAGVTEGSYVNRAEAFSGLAAAPLSGEATATVRVVPDPTFSCTDVYGKVFDDGNRNGRQDSGERGLPGVRLVTPRGLVATTDAHGRYHITCAVTPNENRGSNFALKLDDRSLPSGYRMSTRQTRVKRATAGKALRMNYAASAHRVVSLDMADPVFEPGSTEMRAQWAPRLVLLLDELRKSPATLRLSYIADTEDADLVERRLKAVRRQLQEDWKALDCCYELTIEPEIYWRRGAPPGGFDSPWWRPWSRR